MVFRHVGVLNRSLVFIHAASFSFKKLSITSRDFQLVFVIKTSLLKIH